MMLDRRLGFAALAAAALGVAAVAVVLTTRSGSTAAPVPTPPSPPPSPSPSPSHEMTSPFTGEPVSSLSRVLIVKIGNTVPERPATGLSKADIVYLIPVEGGLSRIMAVFSSHYPPVIGPVRSAREDDLALLRQYGRPAFAFSGATNALLPVVQRARIASLFDGTAGGYFRSAARIEPYNLYAHTRQLLAQAPKASVAHGIGFLFGPAPPGGKATHTVRVSYPAATFRFTWSAGRRQWLVWMDGARARSTGAGQDAASTVIIQYTTVRTSRFLEYGVRPPYAVSTGSGRALVMRNGRVYQARWSRPSADGGTTFTTMSGRPMPFAPGQVWDVLTAAGNHWPG